MEPMLNSEVFFLISSFCLVFITLLLIVGLIYVVNIMRIVYEVTKIVKKKAVELSDTLDEVGDHIAESKLVRFLSLFSAPKKKKTKK